MKLVYDIIVDFYDDTTQIRTMTEQAQMPSGDWLIRRSPYGGHHGIFPFFLDAYQSFLAQRYLVLKPAGRTTEISEKSFNNMPPVNGHMPNGSIDSACST